MITLFRYGGNPYVMNQVILKDIQFLNSLCDESNGDIFKEHEEFKLKIKRFD